MSTAQIKAAEAVRKRCRCRSGYRGGYQAGSAEKIRNVVAVRSVPLRRAITTFHPASGVIGIAATLSLFCLIDGAESGSADRIGHTQRKEFTIMKNTIFTGAATAVVTPLTKDGVDYEAFGRLLDWQIEEGIDALVIAGTTGEGSTLTDEEHREVIKFAVDRVAGRVPVIAGTGSNDTAYAIDLTKYACEVGADAMLLVTPYYNKATQKGLIESFRAVADVSTKPCILYNVPSRTGCNLTPASCAVLAKHPNIAAIKEASGNISQIAEIAQLCGDDIDIYSGNDDQIIPVMSLGGKGVISVLSNPLPKLTSEMCHLWMEGKTGEALKIQLDLLPLVNALFCEVNPIPVKAAMAAMGFGENYLRLPLTPMEADHEEVLLSLMREQGLNV